jgi:hypothetical protein
MTNDNLSNQPQNKNEWIVTYVTNNMAEAQIVAGRLKHEGIMAILDYMAGMGAIGISIGNMGEVRVLVHPNDYPLAQDILFPDVDNALVEGDEDTIYYDEWNAEDDDE